MLMVALWPGDNVTGNEGERIWKAFPETVAPLIVMFAPPGLESVSVRVRLEPTATFVQVMLEVPSTRLGRLDARCGSATKPWQPIMTNSDGKTTSAIPKIAKRDLRSFTGETSILPGAFLSARRGDCRTFQNR